MIIPGIALGKVIGGLLGWMFAGFVEKLEDVGKRIDDLNCLLTQDSSQGSVNQPVVKEYPKIYFG